MNWFERLTRATKLACAFLVVLVLSVVIGRFSIAQLSNVNATALEFETTWLPSMRLSGEMRGDIQRTRQHKLQDTLLILLDLEKVLISGEHAVLQRAEA